MGSRCLDAFIDLRSPYSYVALAPARALATALDFCICWRPYAIDIEAAYGGVGERDARALRKVKYIYRDARRVAEPQGLTIRGPKRIYDATLAHIGLLYSRQERIADAYIDAVYQRFFSYALDIEDRDQLAELVEQAGGSGDEFKTLIEGQGRDRLAGEAREAEALGVFGVPSFVYEGELYWGSDRLAMLRDRIPAQ